MVTPRSSNVKIALGRLSLHDLKVALRHFMHSWITTTIDVIKYEQLTIAGR